MTVAQPETPRAKVQRALAALPQFYTARDLEEALGSRDLLIDAYALGWLPPKAVDAIELTDPQRLACWLLTRQIRLLLTLADPTRTDLRG
jgi:hypothetical protein